MELYQYPREYLLIASIVLFFKYEGESNPQINELVQRMNYPFRDFDIWEMEKLLLNRFIDFNNSFLDFSEYFKIFRKYCSKNFNSNHQKVFMQNLIFHTVISSNVSQFSLVNLIVNSFELYNISFNCV